MWDSLAQMFVRMAKWFIWDIRKLIRPMCVLSPCLTVHNTGLFKSLVRHQTNCDWHFIPLSEPQKEITSTTTTNAVNILNCVPPRDPEWCGEEQNQSFVHQRTRLEIFYRQQTSWTDHRQLNISQLPQLVCCTQAYSFLMKDVLFPKWVTNIPYRLCKHLNSRTLSEDCFQSWIWFPFEYWQKNNQ